MQTSFQYDFDELATSLSNNGFHFTPAELQRLNDRVKARLGKSTSEGGEEDNFWRLFDIPGMLGSSFDLLKSILGALAGGDLNLANLLGKTSESLEEFDRAQPEKTLSRSMAYLAADLDAMGGEFRRASSAITGNTVNGESAMAGNLYQQSMRHIATAPNPPSDKAQPQKNMENLPPRILGAVGEQERYAVADVSSTTQSPSPSPTISGTSTLTLNAG